MILISLKVTSALRVDKLVDIIYTKTMPFISIRSTIVTTWRRHGMRVFVDIDAKKWKRGGDAKVSCARS